MHNIAIVKLFKNLLGIKDKTEEIAPVKEVEKVSTSDSNTTKEVEPEIKKEPVKKKVLKTDKKSTDKKNTDKKSSAKKKTTPAKTNMTAKKETTIKKETTKKKKTGTAKAVPKGTKKAEKIALYTKALKKQYGEVDEKFLEIIVKNLGPSIYRKDAELVSCSDPKELDTVRKNFLMKKLGLTEDKKTLDAAIKEVCEELKDTSKKYRALFYYRLAQKFKKESVLS